MRDRSAPGTPDWADGFRHTLALRRKRRRLACCVSIGLAGAPLAASIAIKPPVLLLWNASASAPVGLYSIEGTRAVRRGEMVVAWTPGPARALAAERGYVPANVPLVKRVAAVGGDLVCAAGAEVRVNGKPAAQRMGRDGQGRVMPAWSGCRRLAAGEHLLLMDSSISFDGRYFGPTRNGHLIGRAKLLWRA